jgi:SpoVK/Ycf46/Vps4 family AAA+-type ATPase
VVDQAAGKEANSIVNTMLTLLDRTKHGIIIATTNRPDILDPALLRRFDEQIEFPAPSPEQMRSLASKLCEGFGVPPVDVSSCANFDEVTKRCETEARRAVMRELIAAEQADKESDAADAAE